MLILRLSQVIQLQLQVQEQTEQVNDALGALSAVLAQIDDQLSRRHKDEEYARVYEQEKRRYMNSGTPGRVRRTFDDWLYDVCTGMPNLEHINDYVTEKLVHMFEKGVFNAKVEHIQRATRYPAEFDFSQLDDDHKLRKTVHKHYSEFRKLVDYYDGYLVVDPVKVGRHFFASRHEENAKAHRSAFMKYMHKIELAQQERYDGMFSLWSGYYYRQGTSVSYLPQELKELFRSLGYWRYEIRYSVDDYRMQKDVLLLLDPQNTSDYQYYYRSE